MILTGPDIRRMRPGQDELRLTSMDQMGDDSRRIDWVFERHAHCQVSCVDMRRLVNGSNSGPDCGLRTYGRQAGTGYDR